MLPVSVATSSAIETLLVNFFHKHELDDTILREQCTGFCSDGASTMMGQFNGVSALLKLKYPLVKAFQCVVHRLELAVKNAVETVNVVLHYKSFVDELYKEYSMSPKNQAELSIITEALSIELIKVQKIFDVTWVFSSFVAVRAILHDYAALH